MSDDQTPLKDTIEHLRKDAPPDQVPLGLLLDNMESQPMGVVIALLGLIQVTPLGALPGLPGVAALVVVLTVGHHFMGGQAKFWAPAFLRRKTVARSRMDRILSALEPIANAVDNRISRRLTWLVANPVAEASIAIMCLALSGALIGLSLIPFGVVPAAFGLLCFGLSLLAADGLLALIGYTFVGGAAFGLWSVFH